MPDSAPPGWYPDPGAPGQLRWWDGSVWSAHTRPVDIQAPSATGGAYAGQDLSTGRYAGTPPAGGHYGWQPGGHYTEGSAYGGYGQGRSPAGTAYDEQPTEEIAWGPQTEPARGRPGTPAIVGGALALLLLVLVAGVLLTRGGGSDAERSAAPGPRTSELPFPVQPSEPPSAGPTAPPSSGPSAAPTPLGPRVVDPASGLSYQRLGGAWQPWTDGPEAAGAGTAGESQVTQEVTPSGGNWIANAFLGQLRGVEATASDLRAAALAAAREIETSPAYPQHTRKDVSAAAFTTQDGHRGFRVTMRLTFDPTAARGLDAQSETVAVGVVDTGGGLGVVWVSIPGNRSDLLPAIDKVFKTLRVERASGGTTA